MELKNKLDEAMKNAMRAGDEVTKRTVRMALAAIKQMEIDKRVALDDAAIVGILQKEIKTRKESLEEANQAKRSDLVEACEAEITVLKRFLPEELRDADLLELAKQAVQESGAASPADMGKVMRILIPRVQGRAAGDRISAAVRQLLQK